MLYLRRSNNNKIYKLLLSIGAMTERSNNGLGIFPGIVIMTAIGIAGYILHQNRTNTSKNPDYSQTTQSTQTTKSSRLEEEARIDELLQQSANIKTSNTYTASDGRIYAYEKGRMGGIIGTDEVIQANYITKQKEKAIVEMGIKSAKKKK